MNEIASTHCMTRAQAAEAAEDIGSNASSNPTIGDVIATRLARRDVLRGALGVAALAGIAPLALDRALAQAVSPTRFPFKEIAAGTGEQHLVSDGYDADVLIRWGDAVVRDAPAFDPSIHPSLPPSLHPASWRSMRTARCASHRCDAWWCGARGGDGLYTLCYYISYHIILYFVNLCA